MVSNVYQLHNTHLGDHITSYGLMATLGALHKTRYRLGTVDMAGTDRSSRLHEIRELYADLEWEPILIDGEQGTRKIDPWLNWVYPALPSKHRWSPSRVQKYVTFQFDGISAADSKNPPKLLENQIIRMFTRMGYVTRQLGAHQTLREIAEHLAICSLFIGCDSGMSHIAHSVGCPVFLYEGSLPVATTHKQKAYTVFHSMPELLQKLDHWLWLLHHPRDPSYPELAT